jgi:hypothetical protein
MTIHIFGGGTVQYVRNHKALCAPAYGHTARKLFAELGPDRARLHLTKMADYTSSMETNEEVDARLLEVLADPATRGVVFNVALCDYAGQIGDIPSGKYAKRLSSREGELLMRLTSTPKLLPKVKALRPDVHLVGFKTTAGAEQKEQHRLSLRQMAETGADVVFANDTVTRHNLVVFPGGLYMGERDAMMVELVRELRRVAC